MALSKSVRKFTSVACVSAAGLIIYIVLAGVIGFKLTWYCATSEDGAIVGVLSLLFPAAISGFLTGVLFGKWKTDGALVFGWILLGVISLPFVFIGDHTWKYWYDVAETLPITFLAVPALGSICALRGARCVRERRLRHLAWLAGVVLILAVTSSVLVVLRMPTVDYR